MPQTTSTSPRNTRGPAFAAIREALSLGTFSKKCRRDLLALGEGIDGATSVVPDKQAQVIVGIAMRHPDHLFVAYDPADLSNLAKTHPANGGFKLSARADERLAEQSDLILARVLFNNPEALAAVLRIIAGGERCALAIVTKPTDQFVVVRLPNWTRPSSTCAGRA